MIEPHRPSPRKPLGIALILMLIALWSVAVVACLPWIERLPVWGQLLVYAICGIVWVLPLRPLLRWMEGGSPRG